MRRGRGASFIVVLVGVLGMVGSPMLADVLWSWPGFQLGLDPSGEAVVFAAETHAWTSHEARDGSELFEDTIIAPSDVGQTFTASSANDGDFVGFVELITNGEINSIWWYTDGWSLGSEELTYFSGVGTNGIDLEGFLIQEVRMTINAFPSDGVHVDVTYEIIGIPEPATLSLLAIGGLVIIRRRRPTHCRA